MVGRRSVWSDERVIAATADFVPAADEVWRLQRDDDPECRWFRQAVRGNADPVRGSMQGTYVLSASGQLLGRLNSTDPKRVLAMLRSALERWQELPEEQRKAAPATGAAPQHRWEDSYPSGGLVLERFARDITGSPTDEPRRPVNRDAVWFSKDELLGLLPEAQGVGATRDVDANLAKRLARFSLVDNVRGQTLPFARAAIQKAELRCQVVAVDGDTVTLRLRGATAAATDGTSPGEDYWQPKRVWPRSLQTEIVGEARWNQKRGRFDAFELVAIGSRIGRTTFNGRAREEAGSTHRIGFLLRMAPDDYRVAPTFVNLYGARWIKMPK